MRARGIIDMNSVEQVWETLRDIIKKTAKDICGLKTIRGYMKQTK